MKRMCDQMGSKESTLSHPQGVSICIFGNVGSLVSALVLLSPVADQGVNLVGRDVANLLHLDVVLDWMLYAKINA